LKGKVAIVSGVGGMGQAISLALAQEGADLVLCDINEEAMALVANEIQGLGRQTLTVKTDIMNEVAVNQAVQKTIDTYGKVDVLVNAAGILTFAQVVDLTEKQWDDTMNVNAKGVFLFCKAVGTQMVKQSGGKIVNIASDSGKTGEPHLAHYCASKHAVVGFTEAFALEMAMHNIYVNSVCPAVTQTAMLDQIADYFAKIEGIAPEEVLTNLNNAMPMGRIATPEDVAKVVVFLASSDSDYITGQSINVTGGGALKFCVSE
jgi:NAD(P)-dependent dehydrogenase (short-subunit alcohol dehydrogenase family)